MPYAIQTTAVPWGHRRQHDREEQQEEGARHGRRFEFTNPDGSPLHPAAVTDTFEQIAFRAGLPPIRLHDLRHRAATLALAAGVDIKIVQDMLGHSSRAITSDTYTTALPEVARAAAEAAAALIPLEEVAGPDELVGAGEPG
jgi:integrase